MAKGRGKSQGIKILWSLFLIVSTGLVLAAVGYLTWKGYTTIVGGQNATTIVQNQTITTIQNITNITKQSGLAWSSVFLLLLLFAAVVIIIFAVIRRTPILKKIDLDKVAEQVFRRLGKMDYPFYTRYNGEWKRINFNDLKKRQELGATSWVLQDNVYFQKRLFNHIRVAFRFWAYPKPVDMIQPDWEPPRHEVYCVSVNPHNIMNKWQLLKPMTFDEFNEFLQDQEYGRKVSPEDVEASSLFDLQRIESYREAEKEFEKEYYRKKLE